MLVDNHQQAQRQSSCHLKAEAALSCSHWKDQQAQNKLVEAEDVQKEGQKPCTQLQGWKARGSIGDYRLPVVQRLFAETNLCLSPTSYTAPNL